FPTSGSELIQRAPLLDQVFGVESYRSQYLAYVDLLLRYWFEPENISELAERYYDLIAPYWTRATGDKAFFGNQPMFPVEVSENSWVSLVNFASERNQFLREALATEMQP
ncbi:MAG: CotH kinase family protein, partial [Anaerolineaceae bacterium]|nr:CotH kinase family protein [Anaerolineaceae bacterium]